MFVTINFVKSNKKVQVFPGQTLLNIARDNNIYII
jgi:hypothetical protein